MNIFSKLKNDFKSTTTISQFKLVSEYGNSFYVWNGKTFESDIVRACVRQTARSVGKLVPKHIRDGSNGLQINPDPYMRFLLSDPNPYMSQQQLQEKMTRQLQLNNNAFALIVRDANDYPIAIYPLNATSGEAIYSENGVLAIKFYMLNGKQFTFAYDDIIHLRQDFNDNDVFGSSLIQTIEPLMHVIGTVDKGIVNAVNNSSAIRWLVKYNTSMRPEDLKRQAKTFSDNYLATSSDGLGIAATDSKAEVTQIKTEDFVPNASQMDKTTQRIYNIFGTNDKIIQSKYNEDEWNAYYESIIEPIAVDFSNEYTRKLFSRKERGFGNKIVFEASNLQYASMSTKLNLVQFVDRGIMTPNEVRNVFNFAPIEGGDEALLRKDTGRLYEGKEV